MPTTLRPKDRKAQILAAAATLFAEHGYAAVGVNRIAAAVGVTGPALYRHYRTKEELLATLLEDTVRGFAEVVEAASSSELGEIVGAVVGHVLDHPAAATCYTRERSQFVPDGPAHLVEAERRFRRAWGRALARYFAELDLPRVVIRQQAVLSGLSAAAREHRAVTRPRLDALLTGAIVAVLLTPADPTCDAAVAEPGLGLRLGQRAWSPPASRREAILTAAASLFRQRGVDGVGIDEIGAAAGISGPSVYHYYASKAELVRDLCERAFERVAVGTDDALRHATNPAAALRRVVGSYAESAAETLDLLIVASREQGERPADRARADWRHEEVCEKWALVLRGARPELCRVEADLLARAAFAMLDGALAASEAWPRLRPEVTAMGRAFLLGE